MMKMNLSRYSKLLTSLLVFVVLAAGAAGAVTVSDANPPAEEQVGERIDATFTLNELYQNPSLEEWVLLGETELESVTWTVTLFDQAGNQIDQQSYDGESFEHPIDIESDASEVEVRIAGTVPAVANYTYDPPQQFQMAGFKQVREGGVESDIETYNVHYYTEESAQARQAIDDAQAAIEEAGGDEEAERILNNAISAYQAENFGNAEDLANQAQEEATQKKQGRERTQLLLIAGGGIVILGVIIGAVYLYRQRKTTSKL